MTSLVYDPVLSTDLVIDSFAPGLTVSSVEMTKQSKLCKCQKNAWGNTAVFLAPNFLPAQNFLFTNREIGAAEKLGDKKTTF